MVFEYFVTGTPISLDVTARMVQSNGTRILTGGVKISDNDPSKVITDLAAAINSNPSLS